MTNNTKEIKVIYDIQEKQRQKEQINQRGERMAQCLENIANAGGITEISDPMEWQHEIRKDRPLEVINDD